MATRETHKIIEEQVPGLLVRQDSFAQKLKIEKRIGNSGLIFFFGFFSIIWNMATWGLILGSKSDTPVFLYFSHIPVGLVTAYLFLAFLLNKKTLSASKGIVEIKSHPLPWFGNKIFNLENLAGFTTRRYHAYTQNDLPVYCFKVIAIKKNFVSEDIFKGFQSRNQAQNVEALLEKFYKIEDNLSHDEAKVMNL